MDLRALAMGLLFAAIWSSAFTSARILVQYAPPFAALALRFAISGALAVLIARLMGQRLSLTRRQWIAVVLFGVCQNALYLGLNFLAMQSIEASLAAIIASMLPLLVAAASWLALGERLSAIGLVGLAAGAVGVLTVMGARLGAGADPVGIVLCLIGVAALTLATLLVRGAIEGGNLLMIVGAQMLVGAVALLPVSLLFEELVVDWTLPLIVAFVYTTLVPGLAATILWFALVRRIGATRAATFHFLNPFLGVAIAAVILGEALTLRDAAGVAIIMAGILAVQWSRAR
ncbi:MAG: DMT family transporter [Pseudomonadota bacterium]